MGSKLSFQTFGDAEIIDQIARSRAVGAMTIDYPELLKHPLLAGRIKIGRLLTIGERAISDLHMSAYNSTAAQVVDLWLNAAGATMLKQPDVYWTGPINEGGQLEDPKVMQWYGDIEYIRQKRMRDMGLKACVFNFSTEANIYDKFEPIREALLFAKTYGNLYGTHGYSSPRLSSSPETLFNHRQLRARLGFIPPVAYTEFGADAVKGNGLSGWRTCMGEGEYFADLTAAYKSIEYDIDVVGAFIFVWTKSGLPEWQNFNCVQGGSPRRPETGIGNLVLGLANAVNSDAPAPLPTPGPVPQPLPSTNTVRTTDYVNLRRYPVLLPANVIKVLPPATPLELAGAIDGDFVQVKTWVHKSYIKPA